VILACRLGMNMYARKSTPTRAWLSLALAVAACVVAVFQRVSLGVAGVEAQHRFGITAAVPGLFGVLQLAVYAGLQVPVGVGTSSYTLHDFELAFSVQYAFWAVGLAGVLYSRRRLRTVRGLQLDPFPRAVIRVWRERYSR
jgi:hypothetical protein